MAERATDRSETSSPDVEYWRREFSEANLVSRIPSGIVREGGTRPLNHLVRAALAPDLVARLRLPPISVEVTVLAALFLLVGRLGGSEDVVLGFVDHRDRVSHGPRLEATDRRAGFLLLRGRLAGERRFRELLSAVNHGLQGAVMHEAALYRAVEDGLVLPHAALHGLAPRVDVVFDRLASEAETGGSWRVPGECPDEEPHIVSQAHNPVRLSVRTGRDGGLECSVRGFAEGSDAEQFMERLGRVLLQVAGDPFKELSAYMVSTKRERHDFAHEYTAITRADGASAGTAHAGAAPDFVAPDAPAVIDAGEVVTWSVLDDWAGRVARAVASAGVADHALVGLCVRPGATAVAGVLGIWRAGGVVVTLNPEGTEEHIAGVVRGARLSAVVCQEGAPDLFTSRAERVVLPGLPDAPGSQPPAIAAGGFRTNELAFILFSDAAPQAGVLLTHTGVRSVIDGLGAVLYPPDAAGNPLRILADASPSQGSFVRQLAALMNGHALVVGAGGTPAERVATALGSLRDGAVDLIDCTESELKALLDHGLGEAVHARDRSAPVPIVLVSLTDPGDSVILQDLRRRCSCRVYSLYGPPEASFAASITDASSKDHPALPLEGLVAWVLDRHGQPVPTGTVGQLHLVGPGLARGYYGRPDLNAEHFPSVRFPNGSRSRMYRTGHLARRLLDNRLVHLGAIASHIELYGHQVWPGRMEEVLRACPGVGQVAVSVRIDDSGGKRLVASVVADGIPPTLRQLRAFLWSRVPGCVWPAELEVLPELAVGPGCAVDMTALPTLKEIPSPEGDGNLGSLCPDAVLLATEWAGTLGVDEVPTDTNYGLSPSFLDAVERARARGAQITDEQIHRNSTLEMLATAMAADALLKAAAR